MNKKKSQVKKGSGLGGRPEGYVCRYCRRFLKRVQNLSADRQGKKSWLICRRGACCIRVKG